MSKSREPMWGATPLNGKEARFRIWAPDHRSMRLALTDRLIDMDAEPDGWFSIVCAAVAGDFYQFALPDETRVSDPASRAQVHGVEGPSILTVKRGFDQPWSGRPWEEAVIYEIHIGTFTQEGTFLAAIPRLAELASCGITAIEIMPVAQSPGSRGWGYDGVLQFAPDGAYGPPEALRMLINAAHGLGLMVLLDVVYNHFGPVGNALPRYAGRFFDDRRTTPWGKAIAFDEPNVRRYFLENALYWLTEFGFDGLRLDAVQHLKDSQRPDFLSELATVVREAVPGRHVHLIVEDDQRRQELIRYRPPQAPVLYTASWNDDFHHAIHTIVTGETGGYYRPYADAPWRKLAETLANGFPVDRPATEETAPAVPMARVAFLQNHDQVGNRAKGERLTTLVTDPVMEVLTALLLLSPQTPLLFMGDDYGETRPFFYFADYAGELAEAIRKGRLKEAENFGWSRDGAAESLPDPIDIATCQASKLDWSRAQTPTGHRHRSRLRELTALRRKFVVPLAGRLEDFVIHPVVEGVMAVDWLFPDGTLQIRMNLSQAPEPVPRPADTTIWSIGWRSDEGVLASPGIVVAVGPPVGPG